MECFHTGMAFLQKSFPFPFHFQVCPSANGICGKIMSKKKSSSFFFLLRPATEPPNTELFHLRTLTKTATHNSALCEKKGCLKRTGEGIVRKGGKKNSSKYFACHVPIPRELGKLGEQWLIYQLWFNTLRCSQPPCCLTSCFMLELVGKIGDGRIKMKKKLHRRHRSQLKARNLLL